MHLIFVWCGSEYSTVHNLTCSSLIWTANGTHSAVWLQLDRQTQTPYHVFCGVTHCSAVDGYQHFTGMCCCQLQCGRVGCTGKKVNRYRDKRTGMRAQRKSMVLEMAVLPPTRKMEAAGFPKMLVSGYWTAWGYVNFEAFTAAHLRTPLFWDMTLWQWVNESHCPLYWVISQTVIFILTTVWTSHFISPLDYTHFMHFLQRTHRI